MRRRPAARISGELVLLVALPLTGGGQFARWANGLNDLSSASLNFRYLWCLKSASGNGSDQTTIARQLACSPAQISATVERMRAGGWITQQNAPGDRRRRLWELSAQGQSLLAEMLRAADQLRYPATIAAKCASDHDDGREAA